MSSSTKIRFAALANSVAAGAFLTLAALLLLIGTPALGAPIVYRSGTSDYVGTTLTVPSIDDSAATNPPALDPSLTTVNTGTSVLNLLGSGTFRASSPTGGSARDTDLVFDLLGNVTQGTRNTGLSAVTKGYAITGLTLSFAGDASYFGTGANSRGSTVGGIDFSLEVTEVNFQNFSGSPYTQSLPSFDFSFAGAALQSPSWDVGGLIDWNLLKAHYGLNASDYITAVKFNALGADISTASSRGGNLTTSVNAFSLTANTELVAVPEPPTVILAGLGVAAVVPNGYRRRLRRKGVDSESAAESMEGAVALTA